MCLQVMMALAALDDADFEIVIHKEKLVKMPKKTKSQRTLTEAICPVSA